MNAPTDAVAASRTVRLAVRARRKEAAGALARWNRINDAVVARSTLPAVGRSRAAAADRRRSRVALALWHDHVVYARTGDAVVRDRLVDEYAGHARSLARRWYRHREPIEDLEQVALEGLLVALNRFDPRRRRPFLAFAGPTITGLLKHHYRDAGWLIRVPRRVHELARPVRDAADMLAQDFGRAPTVGEIADVLGLDAEEVREAMIADDARATSSLDAPAATTEGAALGTLLGGTDPRLERVEVRAALSASLGVLPRRDRQLLHWYFADELTQTQIGEQMGVSQMQVSRLLSSALRRLRSRV